MDEPRSCIVCGKTDSNQLWHCGGCEAEYCEDCWGSQVPHKRKMASHEKMNAVIAKRIRNVMRPPSGEREAERLHTDDLATAWFGVHRLDDTGPIFQLYGRFGELVSNEESSVTQERERNPRTPGIVSFVGDTGAGKSTLVKLLIDIRSSDTRPFQTPVVGSSTSIQPTSEDVNLYADPSTANTDTPIVFADCEGLLGGDRAPLAATVKQKLYNTFTSPSQMFNLVSKRGNTICEREIMWPENRSRQFAVKDLYPRLLYIFSDVVVFVVKNPK